MAFSTRRFVKHIDKYNVTHRLEIQEDGFGGGESAIHTTGQVFQFEHETHSSEDEEILNIYENPVQKGSIELFLRIDNTTDRTLITDIFEGDEDDFRLVWKIDGTIFWTGTILNDMLEYPESDYPYQATLWAKDFSRLEGIEFTLEDKRQTLITTFASLIGRLGYGLDIETHTSWITQDTTDATDFLQQIYHETKALRNFAKTGDESDTTITVFEALEMMCRNFCCVLRQEGGVFKLIQYSEYETPAAVNVTVYNSSGGQKTAATSTDITLDVSVNDIIVTDRSITRAFKAIRNAKNRFDHRTKQSDIVFPKKVELDSGNSSDSFNQFFISDGTQVITISGNVLADFTGFTPSDAVGKVTIRVDAGATNYYWDEDNTQWATSTVVNEFPLQYRIDAAWGPFSFTTNPTPAGADGDLIITFTIPFDNTQFLTPDEAEYTNLALEIDNQLAEKNTDHINYKLTQSGGYSSSFDSGRTWFGDGPVNYAVSALRSGNGDNDTIFDGWQRRGTTTGYRGFHENYLKEIIDLQRGNRIRIEAHVLGSDYDTQKILSYRGKNIAYAGGQFIGAQGDWKPVLFEINIQTGSDTFEEILKFTSEGDSGGTGTATTGGGGSVDIGNLDSRYLRVSQDGADISSPSAFISNLGIAATASELNRLDGSLPAVRTNLGLGTGDDVDFNSLKIGGAEVIDSSRNLTAVAGAFTGLIDAQAGIDIDADSANTSSSNTSGVNLYNSDTTINNITAIGFGFSNNTNSFSRVGVVNEDRTAGSEDQRLFMGIIRGGSYTEFLSVDESFKVGYDTIFEGNNTKGFSTNGELRWLINQGSASSDSFLRLYNDTSTLNVEIHSDSMSYIKGGGLALLGTSMQGYTALYANGTVGVSGLLESDTFLSGVSGWRVADDGDSEFNTGDFRGLLTVYDDVFPDQNYVSNIGSPVKKFLTAHIAELRAEIMTIDERRVTTGGRFNVGIGNILASDISAGATSISVEYNNLNSGDILHLEKVGQVEFMQVTSAASGTGPYTYSVTRDLDGSGANAWTAGDGIFNTAQTGSGFIDMYATTSLLTGITTAGPTTAYMERTGSSYNNIDIRAVAGDMKGWYGYATDTYGFAAGNESGDYVTIDPSNGIRFIDGADSDKVLGKFSGQVFIFGDVTEVGDFAKFDNTGASVTGELQLTAFDLNAGSGALKIDSASEEISFNSGDVTIGSAGFFMDANPSAVWNQVVWKHSGNADIHGVIVSNDNTVADEDGLVISFKDALYIRSGAAESGAGTAFVDFDAINLQTFFYNDVVIQGELDIDTINPQGSSEVTLTGGNPNYFDGSNFYDVLTRKTSDLFDDSGTYANLRAQATTKGDVGLGSVPNVDATNASNISSGMLNADRLPTTIFSGGSGESVKWDASSGNDVDMSGGHNIYSLGSRSSRTTSLLVVVNTRNSVGGDYASGVWFVTIEQDSNGDNSDSTTVELVQNNSFPTGQLQLNVQSDASSKPFLQIAGSGDVNNNNMDYTAWIIDVEAQ